MRIRQWRFGPSCILVFWTIVGQDANAMTDPVDLLTYGEPELVPEQQIVSQPTLKPNQEMALQFDNGRWLGLKRDTFVVYLWLNVKSNGRVGAVAVAVSSGSEEFDSSVVKQIQRIDLKFVPGTVRGRTAEMRVLLPVGVGNPDKLKGKYAEVLPQVEALQKAELDDLEKLRLEALAKQTQELNDMRQRYPRESPYRILPRTSISDDQMAIRIFQTVNFITHCGDSVFQLSHNNELYEYKGSTYTVVKKFKLTELDKLNSIQWKGVVEMSYKYVRNTESSTSWGDWVEASSFSAVLQKQKGIWSFDDPRIVADYVIQEPRYMTCSRL